MTADAPVARGALAVLGTLLGVLLVLVAEFGLLTVVYHSGDGADRRIEAWTRLRGAEAAWMPGDPTRTVQRAVVALDTVAGDRSRAVDAAAATWSARPTRAHADALRTASSALGARLRAERSAVDRRAAYIHASLLAAATIGWFVWFGRVVRRHRRLQSSLTATRVAQTGEQRLIALGRNSADLVMVVEPDATVSFASPSTLAVLGRAPEELVGSRVVDLIAAEDGPLLTGLLAAAGSGDQAVLLHARHADERELVLEGTLTNLLADASVGGWVLTVRDVTERLALQGELAHQAMHDALTGLANRQRLTDRLSHALRPRGGDLQPLVVMFVDLDDFKNVNDAQGHGVGDQLLAEFAGRLSGVIRQGDTAARLGGDEFAVLMEDVDLDGARAVADRLVEALEAPIVVGGTRLSVRASVGLAVAQPGETSAAEALRHADVAMYLAKDRGKGRIAVYDSELHAFALRKTEVRGELSRAIQADELVLHFQPAYDLQTGAIDGYEALVRWQHPRDGLLYPDRFIDIAEQCGLVVPLGRWVLEAACRAAADHLTVPECGPVMAVNVSARQLTEPGYVDEVVGTLTETGFDPNRLVLEITETTLLGDRDRVVETLTELRALGIKIAIDDFGTGYSSLSYLADLPVDVLKIDRSFVTGLANGGESLVEAIIALGHSLGLITLAEGVEDVDQADWLRAAGCRIGQGYLWSRPVPLPDARAILLAAAAARPVATRAG